MSAQATDEASSGGAFWTGELDYRLPEDRIAQQPAPERAASRLMVLDRAKPELVHASFGDIGRFLPPRALLVVNDSRVIPARLRGRKRESGGAVEALLLGTSDGTIATAMVRAAKPLRAGQVLDFPGEVSARVLGGATGGRVELDFAPRSVAEALEAAGELPLPPYIARGGGPTADDLDRYQTVYAEQPGSVAAPTAGLHFSRELLEALQQQGFELARVTLHVGPGTFTPVRGNVEAHEMEEERYSIPRETAARIAAAKIEGRSVVAVGTTTVRTLETAAFGGGTVEAGEGRSRLFIRPGHAFRVADALVTNFHLPGSTLLALVMALAGRQRIREAYETAVREGYRFYSYGDAMLIR